MYSKIKENTKNECNSFHGREWELVSSNLHLDKFFKDEYEFIGLRKQNKNIGKNTLSLLIILKKICLKSSQGLSSRSLDNTSPKSLWKQIGQYLLT